MSQFIKFYPSWNHESLGRLWHSDYSGEIEVNWCALICLMLEAKFGDGPYVSKLDTIITSEYCSSSSPGLFLNGIEIFIWLKGIKMESVLINIHNRRIS